MRLHHLQVRAFGPFAGTEEVDLQALGEAGLFLLHGRTGAGKTSVLDAVCYALYGVVPGARARNARLRSDHAATDVRTCVQLELTVRGRRLQIRREPAWERAKLRGPGTTTAPAKTQVAERVDGRWEVLSTRNDEAGHLIRELMGMSADQFCQVVLLPQGEFAQFLRADAEARRPLLEQLFDTRRFSAVETWLAQRRDESRRDLDTRQGRRRELLARVAQAAGLDTAPDPDEDTTAWLAALLADAIRAVDERDAARQAVSATLVEAQTSHSRTLALAAAQERHRTLAERARAAEATGPRRQTLRAELDGAARAVVLGPLLSRHRATAAVCERTARDVRFAAEAFDAVRDADGADPRSGGGAGLRSADATARGGTASAALLDELRAEATRVEALLGEEERHVQLTAALRDVHARADRTSRQVTESRSWLADAGDRRTSLGDRCAAAVTSAAGQPHAEQELDRAEARCASARTRDELAPRVATAARRASAAVDAAQRAKQDWLDLRQARIEGMAAELARALAVGACCPVCGSDHHPAPATGAGKAVDAGIEKAAQLHHQECETERGVAEQEAAALVIRHTVASAAAGTATLAEVDAQRRSASVRLRAARAAAGELPLLEGELAILDGEVENQARRLRDGDVALAGLRERAIQLARQLAELATRLAAARGGHASLAERHRSLGSTIGALDRLSTALSAQSHAIADTADAEGQLLAAARQAGFDSVESAVASARGAGAVDTLTAELERLSTEAATVAHQLTDPDLAAAARAPAARPAQTQAALEAAQTTLELAAARAATAHRTLDDLEGLRSTLTACDAEVGRAAARHRTVEGLSRLVEGTGTDNVKKMRLSAYVLAARLEQVAAAATERLDRMSSGRYALVHTDEGSGRGRAGLGLRVVDAWTGTERDTTSLSGGESFVASLALALGLADVVTSEAGGAPIETLFVDEGFGTLDEDTLDEVMDVLDGLRSGGRVVGVVSHVADLRQRIPAQLHVRKQRDGSTLAPQLS